MSAYENAIGSMSRRRALKAMSAAAGVALDPLAGNPVVTEPRP